MDYHARPTSEVALEANISSSVHLNAYLPPPLFVSLLSIIGNADYLDGYLWAPFWDTIVTHRGIIDIY
jgi:hypothetical protein